MDVPDLLLFADADAKSKATKESSEDKRYRHGVLIVESKRWERPLDRGEVKGLDLLDPSTPSNQILRYLSTVDVASNGAITWGILTNGRVWRLYWQKAQSRSEDFLEIDLAEALGLPGVQATLGEHDLPPDHALRIFALLFGRAAFLPQADDEAGRTLHAIALGESSLWESAVSKDLGERVFSEVFPLLANALIRADDKAPKSFHRDYLLQVRDAALIILYRLLFVFYAEDRNLLPVRDKRYDDYSLRKLRREIAERLDSNDALSGSRHPLWDKLSNLFAAISVGDKEMGLPAYNGGLFEAPADSLVRRAAVPDATLARVIDALSRRRDETGALVWINYRDLSVQHLGSVYERLLDFALVEESGLIVARPQSFARRTTGSYYTHDDLVKLIIRTTVGPLIQERIDAFCERARYVQKKRTTVPADFGELAALDPANAILSLKICDPAMGSGHFLVALVDYLADQVLEAAALAVEEGSTKDHPYRCPVQERMAEIRTRIFAAAEANRWHVEPDQLDDRHIVRRMILKRVIHGVDKNPMAVELAKVALWLHTFTVGAPLSFLDHHLRCGDALHGEWVGTVREELNKMGNLLGEGEIVQIRVATAAMQEIAELTDIDIAEAHRSKALLEQIDHDLAGLRAVLDFWRALRWLIPNWSGDLLKKKKQFEGLAHADALAEIFNGGYDLQRILASETLESTDLFGRFARQVTAQADASRLIRDMNQLATREHFLHWEIAFPTVWSDTNEQRRGFDAVIGNPPWDLLQFQEVEWFAERKLEVAKAVRASDRKRLIDQLRTAKDPLWTEYVEASEVVEGCARVVRECGDYPLLSEGRSNLAKLFVERAAYLVKPMGVVGFLVPSGIASDRGSTDFFSSISTTGRLGALFDFENRKVFFPDIHASFKFCALVFSGSLRIFEKSACGFYLHSVDELTIPGRLLALTSEDFAAVNPNTGGAPIFRSRRDAEITTAIYRKHPILVDRRGSKPKKRWPIRFKQGLFNMTTDSKFFKRPDELERSGWYRVQNNWWKRGDEIALPLYEGKMVQLYDHRAANVVVNTKNVHRAAQQEASSLADHANEGFFPSPQFWVVQSDVEIELARGEDSPTETEDRPAQVNGLEWVIGFKDVTAPTNQRTMIAAVLPKAAYGNTLPILVPHGASQAAEYPKFAPLLLANLNSFALDYVARQKVQGQHLNWFIVEQLPIIHPSAFDQKLGKTSVGEFVRAQVLRLTYTANDMKAFARDMGHDGSPFKWDEEERRHRMARLDALYFHLYGISRDDAAYILDTFPIIREQDEKAFSRYRTKDLVLGYMAAVAAGDLETVIAV